MVKVIRIRTARQAKRYKKNGWAKKYRNQWDIADMGYWRGGNRSEIKLLNTVK